MQGNKQEYFPQGPTIMHHLMFPKRTWTAEEDDRLLQLVDRHGPKHWSRIGKEMGGRRGKQCRQRYYNHLNPQISHEPWSSQEEWVLFVGHTLMGNRWSQLTRHLRGRTDNNIKNHWNSIMKKKLPSLEDKLEAEKAKYPSEASRKETLAKILTQITGVAPHLQPEDSVKNPPASEQQTKEQPLVDSQRSLSPVLSSQLSSSESDDLSMSAMLRRIDQRDKLKLQRAESYQYRGFTGSPRVALQPLSSNQSQRASSESASKPRLAPIQHLLEEEQDLPLPIPLRRLSSCDMRGNMIL